MRISYDPEVDVLSGPCDTAQPVRHNSCYNASSIAHIAHRIPGGFRDVS